MNTSDETILRKIIKMYISYDLPDNIEHEVKHWLVSKVRVQEKEEVLWQVWNEVEAVKDAGQARALRQVRMQLGMTPGRTNLRHRVLRITAVAAMFAVIISAAVWLISLRDTLQGMETVAATVITTGEDEKRHADLEGVAGMWLNAESEVVYTDSRDVELDGEGFFSVEKRDGERFSVRSREITATVTGTSFNFRSYKHESSSVISLYEGSLTIQAPDTVLSLAAGHRLEYNHGLSTVTVTEISRTKPDWMRDIINFEDVTVGEILRRIENIYGIQVETLGGNALTDKMELKFEGGLPLDDVLMFMSEISGKFSYRIDSAKVYIYDKQE